ELFVVQPAPFNSIGFIGGPFAPASTNYTLTNRGDLQLGWSVSVTNNWLLVSPPNGVLPSNGAANVTLSIKPNANLLTNGIYSDTITFTNLTNNSGNTVRSASLKVLAFPFLTGPHPLGDGTFQLTLGGP